MPFDSKDYQPDRPLVPPETHAWWKDTGHMYVSIREDCMCAFCHMQEDYIAHSLTDESNILLQDPVKLTKVIHNYGIIMAHRVDSLQNCVRWLETPFLVRVFLVSKHFLRNLGSQFSKKSEVPNA